MASLLYDLAVMTVSSAPGTSSTIGLNAAASINGVTFLSFAAAGATNGQVIDYSILDPGNGGSEIGTATYSSSGPSLTGRTVTVSTNSNSAINASASSIVRISPRAETLNDATILTKNFVGMGQLGNVSGGFLNKFRNGPMDVWQRGTSAITVTTAGAYVADGWIVTPTGASCTGVRASNSRTGANTLYGMQVTGATSVTDITVTQRIESYIAAGLAGKTVTVQAQIYNNTGGSITPTLTTKYAGSTDVWTSPSTDLSATNLQACANSAWTQVAYTLSVSSSATAGYEFIFDFGNNFSTTGKDVVIAECDIRVTTGVATGLNSSPPLPELRPIFAELPFCQRYLNTSYTAGSAPGAATTAGIAQVGLEISGTFGSMGNVRFPATMCAAPTLTFWDGAGNSGKISSTPNGSSTFTNNLTNTLAGAVNISANGFDFIVSVASTTATFWSHYVASAEL